MPSIQEEDRLAGVDNLALWDRVVQAALGEDGRVEQIVKGESELIENVTEDYPFSTTPTSNEISKRRVALRRLEKDRAAAFSTIYNSLSKTVQNKLPKDLASFVDPQPKRLYEHIKAMYSANTGTRQAELWSAIWSTAVPENEDPEPKLAMIRSNIAEIVAATASLTAEQFADTVSAYAAIRSLPSSYGLLASTFISSTALTPTLDDVIARVAAEHRRREGKGEVVNEHGLLAGRGQVTERGQAKGPKGGRGGRQQGGDQWCEHHKSFTHDTADCRSGPGTKTWLPIEEYKRKKDAERKQKGMSVRERKDEDQGTEKGDQPVQEVAGKARELGLSNRVASQAIVIDSGATNPFIKDKHLLSNLVELQPPIPIEVGDGNVVLATHKGRLSFKRIYFDNSYYVPGMAHNLLSAQRSGSPALGAKWLLSKVSGAQLMDKDGEVLLCGRWDPSGVWVANENPVCVTSPSHRALQASEEPDETDQRGLLDWHRRLGHADMKVVWSLGKPGSWTVTRDGVADFTGRNALNACRGKRFAKRLQSTVIERGGP